MLTPSIFHHDMAAKSVVRAARWNRILAFSSLISGVQASLSVEADGDAAHVILVPVAYCEATDRVVQVEARLTFTRASLPRLSVASFHEFSFTILVVSLSDEAPTFETQDRTYALPYLPADCRPLIMPIVSASLRALVAHVRPSTIYRVTKSRNPPAKALQKDVLLTRILEEEGYTLVDAGSDSWGRRFWVLARELTG